MSKLSSPDPGCATLEELRAYWRMPSTRAARELARRKGVRRHRSLYPWFAIWAAEGLALPPRWAWDVLKLPHLTTEDLVARLKESVRTARRRDTAKPDASFPDPVALRRKPKLWRTVEVDRWIVGMPVPVFRRAGSGAAPEVKSSPSAPSRPETKGFDPFEMARASARRAGKMT